MHFTKFIYYLYGWDAGAWCNISKWKFCGFHLDDWMNPENCIVSWSTGLVFLSNQFEQDLEARKFYHEDFCIWPCYLNSFLYTSVDRCWGGMHFGPWFEFHLFKSKVKMHSVNRNVKQFLYNSLIVLRKVSSYSGGLFEC